MKEITQYTLGHDGLELTCWLDEQEKEYQKELAKQWAECFTIDPEKAHDLMLEKGTSFLGFPVKVRDYMPKDKIALVSQKDAVIIQLSSSQ